MQDEQRNKQRVRLEHTKNNTENGGSSFCADGMRDDKMKIIIYLYIRINTIYASVYSDHVRFRVHILYIVFI